MGGCRGAGVPEDRGTGPGGRRVRRQPPQAGARTQPSGVARLARAAVDGGRENAGGRGPVACRSCVSGPGGPDPRLRVQRPPRGPRPESPPRTVFPSAGHEPSPYGNTNRNCASVLARRCGSGCPGPKQGEGAGHTWPPSGPAGSTGKPSRGPSRAPPQGPFAAHLQNHIRGINLIQRL